MRAGLRLHAILLVVLTALVSMPLHAGKTSSYTAGFTCQSAASGGFSAWQRSGVRLTATQERQLDRLTAISGTDPYAAGGYNPEGETTAPTAGVSTATSTVHNRPHERFDNRRH